MTVAAAYLAGNACAKTQRWLSLITAIQLAQPGKQHLQHSILCHGVALRHHQDALHRKAGFQHWNLHLLHETLADCAAMTESTSVRASQELMDGREVQQKGMMAGLIGPAAVLTW